VIRYLLLAIPYAFQLLCIIHVMKNHKEFYWVWIIIILPYVGGLAYLIVEILPGVFSRRNVDAVKTVAVKTLAPGKKLDSLKSKAAYSPTVENRVEYADALVERGDYEGALSEYKSCLTGISKNSPAILYKTASTLFKLEDYPGASELMARLGKNSKGIYEQKAWNALYLSILENTESEDAVSAEYEKISTMLSDREIDLQHLEYLEKIQDFGKLEAMIDKIRVEEASLREMNVRYDKTFYRQAYAIEKRNQR